MTELNKVILMGRLARDPEARYTQLPVVAFGRAGEFAEKYLYKGIKIIVTGHIQTGSYTNREGAKVYTTDVIAEDQEFAESKAASERTICRSRKLKAEKTSLAAGAQQMAKKRIAITLQA